LRTPVLALSVLFCLGYVQAQPSATPANDRVQDRVVITVAERRITASELCSALQSLPPPQRKGYVLHPALAKDWYGPLVALAEEAKREHLGISPESAKLSEVDLDNALVGELIQKIARETQPTEPDIESY